MQPNRFLYSTMGLLSAATLLAACSGSGGASQTWDYEVMGVHLRSVTSYAPQQYADFIEQDQSVDVAVHEWDRWEPDEILENLRTNEDLRQAIAEAEVITYDFAWDWQNLPQTLFVADLCGGSDGQDCLREGLQQAKRDWSDILNLITELHSESPFLLRILLHGDWIYDWKYMDNMTPEQKAVLVNWYQQFQTFALEDARSRGVPIVLAFPEPLFNEANPPLGYLRSDEMHFSEEGSLVIAQLLRETGYEFTTLGD